MPKVAKPKPQPEPEKAKPFKRLVINPKCETNKTPVRGNKTPKSKKGE